MSLPTRIGFPAGAKSSFAAYPDRLRQHVSPSARELLRDRESRHAFPIRGGQPRHVQRPWSCRSHPFRFRKRQYERRTTSRDQPPGSGRHPAIRVRITCIIARELASKKKGMRASRSTPPVVLPPQSTAVHVNGRTITGPGRRGSCRPGWHTTGSPNLSAARRNTAYKPGTAGSM